MFTIDLNDTSQPSINSSVISQDENDRVHDIAESTSPFTYNRSSSSHDYLATRCGGPDAKRHCPGVDNECSIADDTTMLLLLPSVISPEPRTLDTGTGGCNSHKKGSETAPGEAGLSD